MLRTLVESNSNTCERAMPEHHCPECGKNMSLVRVLPPLDNLPSLGAFYCRPCEFADTVPVIAESDAPSLAPA